MKDRRDPMQKIVYAVGLFVLCSQEIERQFKFILPFTNNDDPSWEGILARHNKLSKRTLGEVAGQFVETATGTVEILKQQIQCAVDNRNRIVHHFNDTYGPLLSQNKHDEILAMLKQQHEEAIILLNMLRAITLAIVQSLRDTVYRDCVHRDEIAAICSQLEGSLGAN